MLSTVTIVLLLLSSVCISVDNNLYLRALKHAFPRNFSTKLHSTSLRVNMFPFVLIRPYLNDKQNVKVHVVGYISLQWSDPQLNSWSSSLPEWANLTHFPLTGFQIWPMSFPRIYEANFDKVLYVQHDRTFMSMAKVDRWVDCYEYDSSDELSTPNSQSYRCDIMWHTDWISDLRCQITMFGYHFLCHNDYNSSDSWIISHMHFNDPEWRVRFEMMPGKYGLTGYMMRVVLKRTEILRGASQCGVVPTVLASVALLALGVYPGRTERLLLQLLTVLGGIMHLHSTDDNGSLDSAILASHLLRLQTGLFAETVLVALLATLRWPLDLPGPLLRPLHTGAWARAFRRVVAGRRRQLEDFVIDTATNRSSDDLAEPSSRSGKPYMVDFCDVEEMNSASDLTPTDKSPTSRLSWLMLADTIDKITFIVATGWTVLVFVRLC